MKEWLLKLSIYHGDVLKAQEPGTIRHWACLGTGPNLRWEVIGCIAAVTGICAASLDPSDSLLAETGVAGFDFARRMLDLADAWLGFCRDCQSMNDIFLWDEIAAITARLDKDGFSKVGRIERVTWLRIWVRFACRREDILDLAFGQHTPEEVLHRVKAIQDMTEEQWASLPSFIQRVRDESVNLSRLKPLEKLFHYFICQSLQSNELLLQRFLIRKTGAGSPKLIQTAQAILKDVLHLSQRVDVSSCFMMDINSILVIHGLRSAAIIAVELLKQKRLPHPDSALLPRSQTIQELSVFAARLGAVEQRDGSFAICDQGRKVITRILDRILSPPQAGDMVHADRHPQQSDRPQQNIEQLNVSGTSGETLRNPGLTLDASATAMGDIDFGFDTPYPGHDKDFMQWLEHVDWERPEPWMAL
ncbi:hypothetical protein DL769_007259 [Monosporascus sp. CRB-8-3]|nr:hypothetical protein DL769_007259 [Monosporascus sp. CRB-8-3]